MLIKIYPILILVFAMFQFAEIDARKTPRILPKKKKLAAKKKPAAKKKSAARKKPAAKKKSAARKKPAAKKKPAREIAQTNGKGKQKWESVPDVGSEEWKTRKPISDEEFLARLLGRIESNL